LKINTGFIVGDMVIDLLKEAKYLGIIFNDKLKFYIYINCIIKKGTKFILVMVSITKST